MGWEDFLYFQIFFLEKYGFVPSLNAQLAQFPNKAARKRNSLNHKLISLWQWRNWINNFVIARTISKPNNVWLEYPITIFDWNRIYQLQKKPNRSDWISYVNIYITHFPYFVFFVHSIGTKTEYTNFTVFICYRFNIFIAGLYSHAIRNN